MAYHHGNLRTALVDAAMELARPTGPAEVGLRAATRAAGVSHNAAYRHFDDRDDLLLAVCGRCMMALATLMERRMVEAAATSGADPADAALARFAACGQAYIEFALTEPGWFRTAFAVPLGVHPEQLDKAAGPGGRDPYQLLGDCLDRLMDAGVLPPERRPDAEIPAWAAVHGLSTLLLDGPLRAMGPEERDAATSTLLGAALRAL